MGLTTLLLQTLRLLLLVAALGICKIAEVVDECCESTLAEPTEDEDADHNTTETPRVLECSTNQLQTAEAVATELSCLPSSTSVAEVNKWLSDLKSPKDDLIAPVTSATTSGTMLTKESILESSAQFLLSLSREIGTDAFLRSYSYCEHCDCQPPVKYVRSSRRRKQPLKVRYRTQPRLNSEIVQIASILPLPPSKDESSRSMEDVKENHVDLPGHSGLVSTVSLYGMTPDLGTDAGVCFGLLSGRETASTTARTCDESLFGHDEAARRLDDIEDSIPAILKTPDTRDKQRKEYQLLPHFTPGQDSGYMSSSSSALNSPDRDPGSIATPSPVSPKCKASQATCREDELLHELLFIKEQRRIWKMVMYYHPTWLVAGIPLQSFVAKPSREVYFQVQISVLDRQQGGHIPLSEALSSQDLRERTGLCLTLYDTERQRFVRNFQKGLCGKHPLKTIEANIHVWNRKTSLFEDLAEMLVRPDRREATGIEFKHCPARRDAHFVRTDSTTWSQFLRSADIVGYYLHLLYNRGVGVDVLLG